MHAPPRPGPPPRDKRKGIASLIRESRPGISQDEAERIARNINRMHRQRGTR